VSRRWLKLEVTSPAGGASLDVVAKSLPGKRTWLADLLDDPPFPFAHIASAEPTEDGQRLVLWVWEEDPPS
jgi:hypothetical protein